jgi:hypothetical protein
MPDLCIFTVFPLSPHPVTGDHGTGTNLQRRLGSMLRQPFTVDEIHSPSVIFARSRSFGPRHGKVIERHPLRISLFPLPHHNLGTAGCSRPTDLEPLPTSLLPSGHHRDHRQAYGCEPTLDRPIVLSDCGRSHDHVRGETLRSRVPRSDQPFHSPTKANLTSVSSLFPPLT